VLPGLASSLPAAPTQESKPAAAAQQQQQQQQQQEQDDEDDLMITLDENATFVDPSANRYQYTRQAAAAGQARGAAPGQHGSANPAAAAAPGGSAAGGRPNAAGSGFGQQPGMGGMGRGVIPGLGPAAAIPGLAPGGAPSQPAAAAAAVAAPGMRPGLRPPSQQKQGALSLPLLVAAGLGWSSRCSCQAVVTSAGHSVLMAACCWDINFESWSCQSRPPETVPAALDATKAVFPSEWQPGLPVKLPGQTRVGRTLGG
jgi:hypothetical protein